MKNRLVVAALVALALVAVSALPALAAKPNTSDQLRVTRIVSKTGVSPYFNISADSLVSTQYEGTVKRLMVVDWISFSGTAGAVAEDFTLFYQDDNSSTVALAAQTVLANTTDTIMLTFPEGLPMFNLRTTSSGILKNRDDPCNSNAIIGAQSTSSGTVTMGYHMEATSDRTP